MPGSKENRLSGSGSSRLYDVLSAGRFHITTIAGLGTFTFAWLFTGHYQWFLALVSAMDWFVVNLTNRVVDVPEDDINRITGTGFVTRHRRLLLAISYGGLAASLPIVYYFNPGLLLLRLAFQALGFSYNWPWLPGRRRLKQIYFWKNTASATGFMITVFGYPLATLAQIPGELIFPPAISWPTVVLTGLFFFAFEISYEVIYDLRDVAGDRQAEILTYPVVHGLKTATRIIDGLLLGAMIVLSIGYARGIIPWRIFIMVPAPAIQLILYKRALRRGLTAGDCIALTWLGSAMLLFYNLWAAAGLPGSEI